MNWWRGSDWGPLWSLVCLALMLSIPLSVLFIGSGR